MREDLAERLLASVMGWDSADVARERPVLQAFADYKYDEYEQYQAGRRFIESLALWLDQFPPDARNDAYTFVRQRLVFISRAEMDHLVSSVFPDFVRPLLLRRASADLGSPEHLLRHAVESQAFRRRARSCLYIGLSDGARTAVLRRSNPAISNEQVVADYSGLPEKAAGLSNDLLEDLEALGVDLDATPRFTTVILLDDFSASGISYIRPGEAGKGKISRLAQTLAKLDSLIDLGDLQVLVMLYVATDQALQHLQDGVQQFASSVGGTWRVVAVQRLRKDLVITRGTEPDIDGLADASYDPLIYDKHIAKGGTDGKYGFADCGLPVILSHNTPNNSLAFLWADIGRATALFPRVSRHREES